jgi:hypothetical protein
MKTIAKSLLFLLTAMMLHTAEAAVQKQGNPYTVQSGDTLFDIARLTTAMATNGERSRMLTIYLKITRLL